MSVVWSSFEFQHWLDAGMPVENYKDVDGSIINPSKEVVFLSLENVLSRPDAHFIPKLEALESLTISRYVGTSLPFNFYHLQNLGSLSVTSNSSEDGLVGFPTSVCELGKLQDLKLTGHRFSTIDTLLYLVRDLRTLDLSHNRIIEVPETLSRLKYLEKLNLSDNITVNIEPILKIDSLRSLDLTYTRVSGESTKLPGALLDFKFSDTLPESLRTLWEQSQGVDYPSFHAGVLGKLHDEALQIMEEERENTPVN